MVAPEAVASEEVAASSSSTGLYDFFPTARAVFTVFFLLLLLLSTGERERECVCVRICLHLNPALAPS